MGSGAFGKLGFWSQCVLGNPTPTQGAPPQDELPHQKHCLKLMTSTGMVCSPYVPPSGPLSLFTVKQPLGRDNNGFSSSFCYRMTTFLHWAICPFVVLPLLWLASPPPHLFAAVSLWPQRGLQIRAWPIGGAILDLCCTTARACWPFRNCKVHSSVLSKPEILLTVVTTVFLPSKTIEDDATVFCCLEDTPTEMFHMGVLYYSGTGTKKQI